MPSVFQTWLSQKVEAQGSTCQRTDARLPILVVGAGPAGLAAMAALRRENIAFEGIDAHTQVGGIWDASNPLSSIYEGMRTVTSKFTTHLGRSMPDDLPHFVPHHRAHQYLVDFAQSEGLTPHLRLGKRFAHASKTERGAWMATLESTDTQQVEEREYRAIIFATGSHNRLHGRLPQPLWDQARGSQLPAIHSSEYRDAQVYAGKRVLVVGIGNSGTDIADKVSGVARRTLLSVRTPPWINPATILGTPCDKSAVDSTWLPHWYQMAAFHVVRRLAIGPLSRLGLTTPRHPLLDRVPVTDRGIVPAIREGRVVIRSHVTSLNDGVAQFEDPRHDAEPVDAVIFATGFQRSYPLLSQNNGHGRPLSESLSFFVFHRTEPGLAYMTELVGTWSCWPVFVEQARTIAAYFAAEERGGRNLAELNSRRSVPTPSMKGKLFGGADEFHVDYAIYTRALRELTAWLSK